MLLTALLVLLGAVLLIAGCQPSEGREQAADTPPARVEVASAQERTQALPIRTSGRLASKAEIPLSFKIDGFIQQMNADEGDRVQRGQTLARLNLSEIDAQVTEATSALDKAERDLTRTRQLYRDSVATLEEMQNAETAVEMAEAQLQRAQFNRRHAVIVAPESGRILERTAETGQYVSPGTPIFRLGASSRGWVVRAGLPDRDIVQLSAGDSAEVRFDAYPGDAFMARVTEIADAADPRTGTFEVELAVEDPEQRLKSGFIGKVDLFPSGDQAHVVVPAAALAEGDGAAGVVYVHDREAGQARRRDVRIVRILDDTIVLTGGLEPGTTVITTGASTLIDGQPVEVVHD